MSCINGIHIYYVFCLPDITVQPAQNEMGRLMSLDLLFFGSVFKAIFSLLGNK